MSISSFVGGVPGGLPNPDSKIVWDAENPNQIVGTFIIDAGLHKKLQKVLKNIIRDYKKSKKEGKGIEGGLEDDDDEKKITKQHFEIIIQLWPPYGRQTNEIEITNRTNY